MAKVPRLPKATGHWSKEKLRQRGVRAVVEMLRLRQQHAKLCHDLAGHFKVSEVVARELAEARLANQSLCAAAKERNNAGVCSMGKRNFWLNDNRSPAPKAISHVDD